MGTSLYREASRIPGLSQWSYARIESELQYASDMTPEQFDYHRFVAVEDVLNFMDYGTFTGTWRGDECGCHDDRCIGYHHWTYEECGCLSSWISEFLESRYPDPIGPLVRWVDEVELDSAIDLRFSDLYELVDALAAEANLTQRSVEDAFASPEESAQLSKNRSDAILGWSTEHRDLCRELMARAKAVDFWMIPIMNRQWRVAERSTYAVADARQSFRNKAVAALNAQGVIICNPSLPIPHYQVAWGYEESEALANVQKILETIPLPTILCERRSWEPREPQAPVGAREP